jgi:predicted metalloenzyme YecM
MFDNYYSINSLTDLSNYVSVYIPLVESVISSFGLTLKKPGFKGDHLGLQTLSSSEFASVHNKLIKYSTLVHSGVVHNRKNNVYKFNQPIKVGGFEVLSLESFEPKPEADISKLKPGIEHLAVVVKDFDRFYAESLNKGLPVDKYVKMNGSAFFKTSLINMVEVEFRDDYLFNLKG